MKESQKTPSGQRQLKVYERFFSRLRRESVIVPEIRLCGRWLEEIGFGCGQMVMVKSEEGKIVIVLDEKEP